MLLLILLTLTMIADDATNRSVAAPHTEGLAALHCWLFDFPQLEAHRQEINDGIDHDLQQHTFDQFDNVDIVTNIIDIAEEICGAGEEEVISSSSQPTITSASDGWASIDNLIREHGLVTSEEDEFDHDAEEKNSFDTREGQYKILCALLCHALSDRCEKQRDYVSSIMALGRSDVQQEIMRILQENQGGNNGTSSDVEDYNETGDYSAFMEASVLNTSGSFDEAESDNEDDNTNSSNENENTTTTKRDRSEAFGGENGSLGSDSPVGKKHHHAADEEEEDTFFEEEVGEQTTVQSNNVNNDGQLQATVTKLQAELKESRQQEIDLTMKVDEHQAQHRAEMLQVESKYLKMIRDLEDKYTNEISQQKRELETLRDHEQKAKDLKEENARLRDDLDVLECSKEKLSYTEEQLRKCKEKIELIGDAHDALQREEKVHAASVDKCLSLENELAQLKPLKRQLEEYRVRAADAEVALAECREDLRRVKEKSSGLEGTNKALQRGAHLQQAEAGNLQKRLQEEGVKSGDGGTAVGVGMR